MGTPEKPYFDFTSHFDTTVPIGDVRLPIKIRRLERAELDVFMKGWREYVERRGQRDELPADERDTFDTKRLAFMEQAIRENVTLDEGYIRDNGAWVITGDGLIAVFHARPDVLTPILAQVHLQNHLTDVIRKNSNSPLASGTGSPVSAPMSGEPVTGDGPASVASPAGSTDSAGNVDATAPSTSEPSGTAGGETGHG
jgi:hypothetical protein